MLLMIEEGIRGGNNKVNNKYMKNYDKSIRVIISNVFKCK